jgi:hypothetical protein
VRLKGASPGWPNQWRFGCRAAVRAGLVVDAMSIARPGTAAVAPKAPVGTRPPAIVIRVTGIATAELSRRYIFIYASGQDSLLEEDRVTDQERAARDSVAVRDSVVATVREGGEVPARDVVTTVRDIHPNSTPSRIRAAIWDAVGRGQVHVGWDGSLRARAERATNMIANRNRQASGQRRVAGRP